MKKIILSQNKFALIDDKDFEYLNQFKWYCGSKGYAIRHSPMVNGKRTKIYMHKEILSELGMQTDHINGNRLDNRRGNLRACTKKENLHNQALPKNNKSGYKGVFKIRDKWRAQIGNNGKIITLGLFKKIKDAAEAYRIASNKYHGVYGRII